MAGKTPAAISNAPPPGRLSGRNGGSQAKGCTKLERNRIGGFGVENP